MGNIGIGQILLIILFIVLLFGNLPKLLKDLALGIKNFQSTLKEESKTEEKTPKSK